MKKDHTGGEALQDIEETIGDSAADKKKALVLDKTSGFKKYARRHEKYRNAKTRVKDWAELSYPP